MFCRKSLFALSSINSSSFAHSSLSLMVVVSLSACGGRDDSHVATFVGQAPDNVVTEVLQRNAASVSGDSIGTALSSVVNTINNSTAVNNALNLPGVGLSSADSPDSEGVFNDPTEAGPLLNDGFDKRVRSDSGALFDATLGLSGSATATREGNTITINPDETEICQQQGFDTSVDLSNCTQLLADLTVNIEAQTDQSGLIKYFFRDSVVAEVGYSPVLGSYELKLAGLQVVMNRMAELDSTTDPVPETMRGSVRFEARVLNATQGAEAGSFAITIPEAVTVVSRADGTDVQIGRSTLMEVSANSTTGAASIEVAIGALEFASRDTDLAGSPMQKLMMAGLTMRADLSRNGRLLTMSNVGLANGPLVMSVDSLEALRLTMDNFGYTVDENKTITLNGGLNFQMMANNVLGVLDSQGSHDSTANYTISAAPGTVFTELANGILRLDQGGPMNVNYDLNDGSSQANGSVTVNQGQCFGDNVQSDSPIVLSDCN